jgi:acetaldehyde dehydrogenase
MRDTIHCAIPEDADQDAVAESIRRMADDVSEYVPGYRLLVDPQFDDPSSSTGGMAKVSIYVEVEGAGDFLPPYAGNLDIMTAAAAKVGSVLSAGRLPQHV